MTSYKYRCELVLEEEYTYKATVDSSDAVVQLAENIGLINRPDEHVFMFCLDVKGNVVGIHEIAHGTISGAVVRSADVFKRALLNNAKSIILLHNHPSGDITPSPEDKALTKNLTRAAEILGVPLLDHIIVGFGSVRHYSFSAAGLM